MSLAILLAGIALLIGGLADLLYRVAQDRGIDSGVFVFWQSIIFSAILWVYAIASGDISKLDAFTWVVGLPAGALGYAGLTLFIISVKTGDVSVNAPIFRLNFVITCAGAMILLGESKKWKPNRATRMYSPWIAILQLIWASLTLTALSFGEASIIYPIVQLRFVVTAVLGIILLHENLTKGKAIGIVLALGAVGALAIA